MQSRGGMRSITLTLDPEELGRVTLRVVSYRGLISASLRVESPEAERLFRDGLADLRQRLAAQGLSLDRLDIRREAEGQADRHSGSGAQQGDARQGGEGKHEGRGPQQEDSRWPMQDGPAGTGHPGNDRGMSGEMGEPAATVGEAQGDLESAGVDILA